MYASPTSYETVIYKDTLPIGKDLHPTIQRDFQALPICTFPEKPSLALLDSQQFEKDELAVFLLGDMCWMPRTVVDLVSRQDHLDIYPQIKEYIDVCCKWNLCINKCLVRDTPPSSHLNTVATEIEASSEQRKPAQRGPP